MNLPMRTNRGQGGVALPLALFALVMLSGLLLAFLTMAGMEPTIAANLGDTARARYVADAGVEWAYDQLAASSNWSAILAANGGTMATNMTLPGLTATNGIFSVTARNDIQPNDNQITGQPLDTGNNVTDNNNVVILTSAGTVNGVSRQIQVVVSRLIPSIPGAINLPGAQTKVSLPGNMEIYGLDTMPGSSNKGDGPCAPAYGLAVHPSNESAVEASIKDSQKTKILGRLEGINPPVAGGVGDTTIEGDASFTSKTITDFVDTVKGKAHVSLTSTAASPLEYGDGVIGGSCAADWNSPTCWGTPAKPKVVYVKASGFDPSQPFNPSSVKAENPVGAGILIVEDGTLFLKGVSGWQGIIIVTGKNVGFDICCGRIHDVWGAIIVNETSSVDLVVNVGYTGGQHTNIYYSCQAINNALAGARAVRLTSWREF
ncbi:MAG: hypothetical protein HYY64_14410 [Candidatus Rokubacteria bacterium]|nr:hypothetical protein [Candidatus Rokubacteria bacterium]